MSIVQTGLAAAAHAYGQTMKLLNYGDADWLVGDDAAEALLDYCVFMGRISSSDSVEVSALDPDGITEAVTFLIGPATMMTASTLETDFTEPDNRDAVDEIHRRMNADLLPKATTTPAVGVVYDEFEI